MGADEGIDIRSVERASFSDITDHEIAEQGEGDDFVADMASEDRVWIIQCKREKSITPKKLVGIVSGYMSTHQDRPYAYMIAVACDFSKATRDAFRKEMVKYGIQEFYLWGKAELEDMLFLPKNDHLLFAYFGISIQIRRRSMRTQLRSWMTLKRKLVKELRNVQESHFTPVLITQKRHPDALTPRKSALKGQYGTIGFPIASAKFCTVGRFRDNAETSTLINLCFQRVDETLFIETAR